MPVSECVPNLCVVGRCVFPAVLRRGPSCTFILGSSTWGGVVFSAGAPRSRGRKGEITELGDAGGLKQVSKMLVGERGELVGERGELVGTTSLGGRGSGGSAVGARRVAKPRGRLAHAHAYGGRELESPAGARHWRAWLHRGVEGWWMGERAGRPLPGSQVKGNEG